MTTTEREVERARLEALDRLLEDAPEDTPEPAPGE